MNLLMIFVLSFTLHCVFCLAIQKIQLVFLNKSFVKEGKFISLIRGHIETHICLGRVFFLSLYKSI